ncbi:unnamed protein product [Amoebophrya sp. A120]|nr:unnamed protein product [Amoebophrya sp. A120]|eukprot:GSA120T00000571001.1
MFRLAKKIRMDGQHNTMTSPSSLFRNINVSLRSASAWFYYAAIASYYFSSSTFTVATAASPPTSARTTEQFQNAVDSNSCTGPVAAGAAPTPTVPPSVAKIVSASIGFPRPPENRNKDIGVDSRSCRTDVSGGSCQQRGRQGGSSSAANRRPTTTASQQRVKDDVLVESVSPRLPTLPPNQTGVITKQRRPDTSPGVASSAVVRAGGGAAAHQVVLGTTSRVPSGLPGSSSSRGPAPSPKEQQPWSARSTSLHRWTTRIRSPYSAISAEMQHRLSSPGAGARTTNRVHVGGDISAPAPATTTTARPPAPFYEDECVYRGEPRGKCSGVPIMQTVLAAHAVPCDKSQSVMTHTASPAHGMYSIETMGAGFGRQACTQDQVELVSSPRRTRDIGEPTEKKLTPSNAASNKMATISNRDVAKATIIRALSKTTGGPGVATTATGAAAAAAAVMDHVEVPAAVAAPARPSGGGASSSSTTSTFPLQTTGSFPIGDRIVPNPFGPLGLVVPHPPLTAREHPQRPVTVQHASPGGGTQNRPRRPQSAGSSNTFLSRPYTADTASSSVVAFAPDKLLPESVVTPSPDVERYFSPGGSAGLRRALFPEPARPGETTWRRGGQGVTKDGIFPQESHDQTRRPLARHPPF